MKRFQESNLSITDVAARLIEGAIMLYPTDTLPGIGCLGNNLQALDKLFAIKKRDPSKPVSYAFSSFEMMSKYVELSPYCMKFQSLLPGKVTLVLPKKNDGAILHGVKSLNLGCRIPKVNWLLELISNLDSPIVTTSANISGTQPVNRVEEIPREILNQIDILIEWPGELTGVGSTVIDLTTQNEFKILREGSVSKSEIESLILD
ncbi:MAG: threonylcarbamoyl-AMP synthase [Candidatus Heimdallarchaeota archaeon]|nr:threonylcarbamoyl-AMP synthase [Candidatus Heimdallarchaeota archaeon]